MPSTIASSQCNKTFKWASQQRVKSGRVHKRTGSNASSSSSRASSTLSKKPASSATNEIARLESEITFTYDAFATVSVMFDSLQHAYASSKAEMDRARSETRLSEKEKELLAAYDDLGLQVVHLERHVVKLEKRLAELRSASPAPTPASVPAQPQQPQPQAQAPVFVEEKEEEAAKSAAIAFDMMTTPDLAMPSPTGSPIRLCYPPSTDYFSDDVNSFYPSPPVSNQPTPYVVQDPSLFCDFAMVPPQQPSQQQQQQQQYVPMDNFVSMATVVNDPYYYNTNVAAPGWPMQQF
ncbi:hypothetical protein BDB00DRAFT_809777 [Zychaea mexicana]|uniref:uncharacterized protein n=1 Tax=Zychaea mexicana TaxID=64656 RepID=UPI0022FE907E|nr:uncharacterized protein BDB00DRAFT_809777 [Zychaea mexicana]KAI9496278.1 hypothetical protein BDB00DRAFT_809777 [Zychaea mexicana]